MGKWEPPAKAVVGIHRDVVRRDQPWPRRSHSLEGPGSQEADRWAENWRRPTLTLEPTAQEVPFAHRPVLQPHGQAPQSRVRSLAATWTPGAQGSAEREPPAPASRQPEGLAGVGRLVTLTGRVCPRPVPTPTWRAVGGDSTGWVPGRTESGTGAA